MTASGTYHVDTYAVITFNQFSWIAIETDTVYQRKYQLIEMKVHVWISLIH